MDFKLDDELVLLQQTVAEFARRAIAPTSVERDQQAEFPAEEFAAAAALGLCGLAVPEEFGGNPVGSLGAAVVYEELAAESPALSVTLSVHNSLVCAAVARFGNSRIREKYLPLLTDGTLLGAYCLTESDAGSDAAAIRTSARRDGDIYRISGRKVFVTSGDQAGLFIVFAVTDPDARTSSRISAFAVERDTPGLRIVRKERKMGLRASSIVEIEFSECEMSIDNRLGEEGSGFGIAMTLLDGGRIGIGAQAVGIARGAFERARTYAQERRQFGRPIAAFQAIQWKLADMSTQIEAGRLMVQRAAWLRDHERPHTLQASQAKLFATEMANAVTAEAIQIHGGYGYLEEYQVERYARDARATVLYEGTSEIQRLVIARHILSQSD